MYKNTCSLDNYAELGSFFFFVDYDSITNFMEEIPDFFTTVYLVKFVPLDMMKPEPDVWKSLCFFIINNMA